jgi:hypothetical protein
VVEIGNDLGNWLGNNTPWAEDEKGGFHDGYVAGFIAAARLMDWIIEQGYLEPRPAYRAALRYYNDVLLSWGAGEQGGLYPPRGRFVTQLSRPDGSSPRNRWRCYRRFWLLPPGAQGHLNDCGGAGKHHNRE